MSAVLRKSTELGQNLPVHTEYSVASEAAYCVTCEAKMSGRFCSHCGEKRPEAMDYSLRHLVHLFLQSFISFDKRFFLTLRLLVTRPGALTAEFLKGSRQPYFSPVQLFFFVNIVLFFVEWLRNYLLLPALRGSALATPLVGGSWHKVPFLANAVSRAANGRGITVEQFAQLFNNRTEVLAKTVLILLVPLFSLVVWLLYARRGALLKHLIYSLHLNIVVLIYATVFSMVLLIWGLSNPQHPSMSTWNSVSNIGLVAICAWYLFASSRRVYGERIARTLVKSAVMLVGYICVLSAWQIGLLCLTFYMV